MQNYSLNWTNLFFDACKASSGGAMMVLLPFSVKLETYINNITV